ncbi:ROK family protein [Roseateles asaccharophilus]|uniref:Glucokinase n=1 Tax=Roseateles asaccharophilus TaxID=582607 RepID=A0ABU2ADF7_9BURK|nr:ROK family protein [Roseateles asaccharophilus]MDR7334527.1 glucokinase [Roseateles asaccharophilus]
MSEYVLAADLGGTKILAALVNERGETRHVLEAPTPAKAGAAAVVKALRELLQDAADGHQPRAIGLSLAGVIDAQTACVLDATDALPGWKGTDLRAELAHFGLPVTARNDVHAALLGEAWLGGLRGCRHGALLTLGTGLGAAFLADGQLHTGHNQLAGHLGRTEWLHQGRRVPLESLLSGTGLANLHGSAADGRDVIARLGLDATADSALRTWVNLLALQLHNLHWAFDPGRVLLGGGMIDAREHWWPLLERVTADLPLDIRPAELGSRAGLLGAAHLAWEAVA